MTQNRGYSLIEVMIALTVFAVIGAITSSSLYHAFHIRSQINAHTATLNQLELTFILLQRDLSQFINRPVYESEEALMPSFVGSPETFSLTRSGFINPNEIEKRSHLKRVQWLCSNQQLIRRSFDRLDTPKPQAPEDQILLTQLETCTFQYLTPKKRLMQTWEQEPQSPAPLAVQLHLDIPKFQEATLLFPIPETSVAHDDP